MVAITQFHHATTILKDSK